MATDTQARTIQGVTYGTAVVRLSHTDLTTAGLTQTIPLSTLRAAHPNAQAGLVPANARIMSAHANLIEVFAGGSVASCVIDVGDTGISNELIAAHDVFTGATLGVGTTAGAYAFGTIIEVDYNGDGAAVVVTTTTDNVDALTTGEVEICIVYQALTTDALAG